MGYEECHEDLFVYSIYGELNIVFYRGGGNDQKINTTIAS
jgi:hypothetical protein